MSGLPYGVLPARQLEVMNYLWRCPGGATVAQVQKFINEEGGEPEIAYQTALSHLRVLLEKCWVTRTKDGHCHVYRARIPRAEAQFMARLFMYHDIYWGKHHELVADILAERRSVISFVRPLVQDPEPQLPPPGHARQGSHPAPRPR